MRVAGDPEFEGIPDKLYFKIGEVCELTGVKSHTLRYWEAEFAILRPQRAVSKQRLYRRVDVENILRIKKFIQEDGLTMAGVKKQLAKLKMEGKQGGVEKSPPPLPAELLIPLPATVPAPEIAIAGKTPQLEQGLLFAALPPKGVEGGDKGQAGEAGERKLYRYLKAELRALQKTLKP